MSICGAYRLRPLDLLQAILESYLDAASEDGALQNELAAAARSLRRSGRVPGCWLGLEGDEAEHEASDPEEEWWAKGARLRALVETPARRPARHTLLIRRR